MRKIITPIFVLFFCIQATLAQDLTADSLALVNIYNTCDGPNWQTADNWLNAPLSEWEDVKVQNGRVTELKLFSKGLKNTLPDDIYNLTGLKKFTFREGQVVWNVDEDIQQLNLLEDLFITSASTEVEDIDIFCPMNNLKQLSLISVDGELTIPACIADLPLTRFTLGGVDITNTTIPEFFGNFSAIKFLLLADLGFTGSIPNSLCNASTMQAFTFDNNSLGGELPDCFPLDGFIQINLKNCGLGGAFHFENIGDQMGIINLDGNNFTGDVGTMEYNDKVYAFKFADSKLTGELDANNFDKEWILNVNIPNNNITGLKNWSGFGTRLNHFHVDGNKLDFDDLEAVDVSDDVNFVYAPQQALNEPQTYSLSVGENFQLTCPTSGTITTYQWYHNDEAIAGATDPDFSITDLQVSDMGIYYCEAKNYNLPELTLRTADQTLEISTRVSSFIDSQIQFFPNPTNHFLSIKTDIEIQSLELFNTLGLKSDFFVEKNNGNILLDLSQLSSGHYLLVAKTDIGLISRFIQKM